MAVLSYHSLEDRIVKETFKRLHDAGEGEAHQEALIAERSQWRERQSQEARLRVMKRKMNHGT